MFGFLGRSLLGPHIIALLALSHFKDLKTKSLLETKFSILYMKVLVAQSRPTLCSPTDCGPPGVSVHGILQARILEWVAIPFSRIFLTHGRNPGLLHCRRTLYRLRHQGSPSCAWCHIDLTHLIGETPSLHFFLVLTDSGLTVVSLRRSPRIKQLVFSRTNSASFYSVSQPKSRSIQRVHSFQQMKSGNTLCLPVFRGPHKLGGKRMKFDIGETGQVQ